MHTITSNTHNFVDDCLTVTTAITIGKDINKFEAPINIEANKSQLHILELRYDNYPFDDFVITTPAFKHNKS